MTDAEGGGPRVLFVTGPGGDGTSTVAAATAFAAARDGAAVLLLSAEPAGRLTGLLGAAPPVWPALPPPGPRGGGPDAARVDPGAAFRTAVLAGQRHARPVLDALGATDLDDDELTDLPGSRDLALLHAVRTAHDAGRHDLIVVDLPPAADAVRLLALPEQLRRYLRRLLPPERRTARALRPFLAQLVGLPMPAQGLYEAADRWDTALAALARVVTGPGAAVRLVADPSPRSLALLHTARAGLALHGLALDAVIANRLPPEDTGAPGGRAARRRAAAAALAAGLPVPVVGVPLLDDEPGPGEPAAVPPPFPPAPPPAPVLEDRLAADGLLVWHLPVPGALREETGLVRRGDELVVTTGPFRRVLSLPAALRRCTVAGAALTDEGALAVRFAPDPARWPAGGAGTG
ncbi:ArsA-related P-loop ATPase [Streptomyces sp. RFCAC02]|uniref:ArsA family ATPase n=1 Tax=Streptomyces sp. RFCAC02 TaxID=2499143 RepID=UPI001021668F|nr:ArsA-related P-loop ATPase [Streptomyces sp. RFCAC02]